MIVKYEVEFDGIIVTSHGRSLKQIAHQREFNPNQLIIAAVSG